MRGLYYGITDSCVILGITQEELQSLVSKGELEQILYNGQYYISAISIYQYEERKRK